jgi:hypothetical protein
VTNNTGHDGHASSAAGTAVSTVGAIQQGKSAQNLANYNAQIAQNDAIAARQKAEFDARAQERQARLFAGTQRASMAGTGGELLDMQDVVDMSAEEAELENLAIRYGGEMGYRAGQQKARIWLDLKALWRSKRRQGKLQVRF